MAFISGVFSAYPQNFINKEDLLRLFEHESFNYNQEKLQKIKKIIFSMNMEGRPTCVNFKQFWEDLDEDKCPCTIERPSPENLFRGASFNPSMGDRAIIWESAVKELALRAAKGLIAKTKTSLSDIDCVITNTSSGVMLPNLSTWLPQQLGLTNTKCNYSLDNTGCGGAITCLDVARSTVLSNRADCVLILTVDCASTHMNTDQDLDIEGILPNLLFGDGAAAVLVTNQEERGAWKINEPNCILMEKETCNLINMRVKETGYYLNLSKDLVPSLHKGISEQWGGVLKSLTNTSDPAELEWLIHPGGKAILDTFTRLSPPLTEHSIRHSLQVMREKGNLVSATLIFVLELMLNQPEKDSACLVGPGPGLEIKFLSIERVS
ncbi:uncharacterized protein LOC134822070 [Bolinopsis microptera]|uniref:uncharacterized protein LOC134822070 n=1 Tax=Bolinopsis microptera TaxID=2820187 RepID=UPI00307A6F85